MRRGAGGTLRERARRGGGQGKIERGCMIGCMRRKVEGEGTNNLK